jgi:uncharacterized Tic20 family protein
MSETTGALQFQTTQDERTMGLACGLLSAFTGFLGPLIILVIKRDSLFVKLCALQSLLWHLIYMVLTGFVMIAFFAAIIATVGLGPGPRGGPPPPFFFFVPFLWLFFMLGWVVNVVLGILSAVKANEGIWWPYPVTGRMAKKFLGVSGVTP